MARITREKFKTEHTVFDAFTNRTIFKLLSQGNFDGLIGPVSMGKEANVFVAAKGDEKVILKIYRLENADFNRMFEYIQGDPRFENLRRSRRHVIFAWCRREFKNLLKAREAGVEAPVPLAFANNVIVMSFIGNSEASPKLKHAIPGHPAIFFRETLKDIERLAALGFVHGDLSAFNVLNYHERPVFIDFSHCTGVKNPRFREFLRRDVRNICSYFEKLGVKSDQERIVKRLMRIVERCNI